MRVYYNEIDPSAAQWLRNLMAAGLIPAGEIDERSIADVQPSDLRGYRQCHFFAGIGGWPYALSLAGWSEREVWTGSCPCQPLSSAGQRRGHADERHLWPAFYRLIAECRPATVFGEQVAGKDAREWLAGIRADLESAGYAVGAADLCAAGVGAPHIRQRLFWVADASGSRARRHAGASDSPQAGGQSSRHSDGNESGHAPESCGATGGVAHSDAEGSRGRSRGQQGRADRHEPSDHRGLGHTLGPRLEERPSQRRDDEPQCAPAERAGGDADGVADAECGRRNRWPNASRSYGESAAERCQGLSDAQCDGNPWSDAIWLPCLDGKARRVKPGIQPLVDGLPAAMDSLGPVSRVGTLWGAGNAIVPQVAAEFIRALLEI